VAQVFKMLVRKHLRDAEFIFQLTFNSGWRLDSLCREVSDRSRMMISLLTCMSRHYDIGYGVVSLIFITNAIGFLCAALVVSLMETKFGRSKTYMTAEAARIVAFAIIASTPPFGAVVAFYLLAGFGEAINLSLSNVFCVSMANSTQTLGIYHGCYGLGGTIGPLIATAIVSDGAIWSRFYLLEIALVVASFAFAGWAFHGYDEDEPSQSQSQSELKQTESRQRTEEGERKKTRMLWRAAKNNTTILGALFIFTYQGAEVAISGWVITFLVAYRGGNPNHVGYVTAGFWAGITLGRFILSRPAHKVGEKISVVALVAGSVGFQLLAWLVPNVVGDAVAVAILGFLLGPIYPCSMNVFSRLLPKNIQMSSLSIISALGSSGGALVPFVTGISAQKVGTFILHPIAIGCYVLMETSWLTLPRIKKQSAK
jgi:fucose permease